MLTVTVLTLVFLLEFGLPKLSVIKYLNEIRNFKIFEKYTEKSYEFVEFMGLEKSKSVGFLMFAVLLLMVGAIQMLLRYGFGFVPMVLFQVLVLYYCLGDSTQTDYESVFIAKHEQAFGILFWFLILGPMGAVMYKYLMVSRLTLSGKFKHQIALTDFIHGLAAWLPARITGLIYALVGDFVSGFHCWQTCMQSGRMQSSQVLKDCGRASLGSMPEAEGLGLVERAFIAWVVLSIIFALAIKIEV